MNKRLVKGAALAAIIAMGLGAARAYAHEAPAESKRHDRRRGRLGLSGEQRAKMKAAGKERREAVRPLREKLREESAKLREQLHSGAAEKDLEATMANIADLRRQIQRRNEEFRSKADALLTPTQRAKLMMGTRRRRHAAWRSRSERFHGWRR